MTPNPGFKVTLLFKGEYQNDASFYMHHSVCRPTADNSFT